MKLWYRFFIMLVRNVGSICYYARQTHKGYVTKEITIRPLLRNGARQLPLAMVIETDWRRDMRSVEYTSVLWMSPYTIKELAG